MTDYPNQQQFERAKDLLEQSFSHMSLYHNHKENMAHAGFLLQAALFGSLITMSWPLSWIDGILCFSSKEVAFCGYFLLWLIIHIFIRWQLRMRRLAAILCDGFSSTLRKWVNKLPTKVELKSYKHKKTGKKLCKKLSWVLTILDYIFIIPSVKIQSDVKLNEFPKDFVDSIKKQKKKRKRTLRSELLLTIGSILILILVWFRTFYGK